MTPESRDALRARRIAARRLQVVCALISGRDKARCRVARDQDKPFRRTQ